MSSKQLQFSQALPRDPGQKETVSSRSNSSREARAGDPYDSPTCRREQEYVSYFYLILLFGLLVIAIALVTYLD